MKAIVRYFAKKYVSSIITDLLEAASKKMDLEAWKQRVKTVLQFCEFLLEKLDDNKLTADECDAIVESAKKLIK